MDAPDIWSHSMNEALSFSSANLICIIKMTSFYKFRRRQTWLEKTNLENKSILQSMQITSLYEIMASQNTYSNSWRELLALLIRSFAVITSWRKKEKKNIERTEKIGAVLRALFTIKIKLHSWESGYLWCDGESLLSKLLARLHNTENCTHQNEK